MQWERNLKKHTQGNAEEQKQSSRLKRSEVWTWWLEAAGIVLPSDALHSAETVTRILLDKFHALIKDLSVIPINVTKVPRNTMVLLGDTTPLTRLDGRHVEIHPFTPAKLLTITDEFTYVAFISTELKVEFGMFFTYLLETGSTYGCTRVVAPFDAAIEQLVEEKVASILNVLK